MSRAAANRKRIKLALQGGGTHGAFTWGVLDRLLRDERLEIEGIVGTSAGAMNAAVLADGLAAGGAALAREMLAAFWNRLGAMARVSPVQPSLLDRWLGLGNMGLVDQNALAGGTLALGNAAGVWRSTDHGDHWILVTGAGHTLPGGPNNPNPGATAGADTPDGINVGRAKPSHGVGGLPGGQRALRPQAGGPRD